MKEFLFIYRADYINMPQSSPEEMQAMTKRWMNWIGGIAAQQQLVDRGSHHLYYSLLGELYTGVNNKTAREHFEKALNMAKSATDQKVISRKIQALS